MNYTNTANLPQPLVSAIMFSDYDKVGDISVSGLVLPPRIVQLMKRHDAEIVEDVAEGIWRLIGSIGHKIVERADTTNHLAEERLTMLVNGWVVSGKADLLGPDMILDDYKFRSVWAMKEAKPEDEAQLNLYSLLYWHNGFDVKQARIVAVLRDWSKPKAKREPDYPQVGVVVREIPLRSREAQQILMEQRVLSHQLAAGLSDDDLPMCTAEERWRRPDVYAVKKKGGKRAVPGGLHSTLEAAKAFAIVTQAGAMEIERRPGEDVRCLTYCPVKEFCSYGRTLVVRD